MDERRLDHEKTFEISQTSAPLVSSETAVESPCPGLSNEPPLPASSPLPDAEDGDRLGGFVWKFPSEGTNHRPGETLALATYPRKCRYCHRAWISSFVNERRHAKICIPNELATTGTTSLGIARRVWCEVDATLNGIQWREDVDGDQYREMCRIAFEDMIEVTKLDEPIDSFQVTTRSGRRIVFQCRTQQEAIGEWRVLDAQQWTEYLQMFSRYSQAQEPSLETIGEDEELQPLAEEIHLDPEDEIQREIVRLMTVNDADALEEILQDDELTSAKMRTDRHGSSLLIQAIQLDVDVRIIRVLLRNGVDCNAKNHDGESPLLLAAASGNLELLKLLVRAPEIRVNQRGALGATALHAAANAGDVAALRVLCDHDDIATKYVDENGWTTLHYAAACKTGREAMAFLCELMPDFIDTPCIQGNTPLHVAAGCGCEGNMRVLLQTAANPHLQNVEGHTAYHVALHNHHIGCAMAVHDYMETPRDAYERVAVKVPTDNGKEDRIAPSETTAFAYHDYGQYAMDGDYDSFAASAWMECFTEDQTPYYYNTVTGESTWHAPQVLKQTQPPPPPPPMSPPLDQYKAWSFDEHEPEEISSTGHGQKLPLCMIPLVSPLVSLDDPTAATKFDSRRKKDRERRRSKMHKHRQHHISHKTSVLPPPPPEHSLSYRQRRSSGSR